MQFRQPREIVLSSDLGPLLDGLAAILCRKRKVPCHALLLEFLDPNADVDLYDDFCNSLFVTLGREKAVAPRYITVAVANPFAFLESVFLRQKLMPLCNKKKITLILLSDNPEHSPELLCHGSLTSIVGLPPLEAEYDRPERASEPGPTLSAPEIESMMGCLFGHFELDCSGRIFHLPIVASVRKLAENATFVNQLRQDLSVRMHDSSFAVWPFGIPMGGIRELAIELVEGSSERLLASEDDATRTPANSTAVLCDFIGPMYPLNDTVRKLHSSGCRNIVVAGIGRFRNTPHFVEASTLFYFDVPFSAINTVDASCKYCDQGIPPIKGQYFDAFARQVESFDPVTFWELVAQHDDFYSVGHWPSDRTPNHYHFRVMTEPIFGRHSFDLALRIRNALTTRGIIPRWIRKIVIPDEPEAKRLGLAISDVLGLRPDSVIGIPRDLLAMVAGQHVGSEVVDFINDTYGSEALTAASVLIVDQAAHHFKTLSALRAICEFYDANILSFAVFLDRTANGFSIGEFLHDSHYVALYSWASPPRRAHECPCVG